MVRKIILVVGSAISIGAAAQNKNDLSLRFAGPDTVFVPQRNRSEIPNALSGKDPAYKMQLKGNNGEGFDLYESAVDNMPILVPDKSNTSRMPVVISTPAPNSMIRISPWELKPRTDTLPPAAPFNYEKFVPRKGRTKEPNPLF
ncbi:MAG TPA: hypothetical protein VJ552_13010 [Sediminibacterium sp.]|nr:hypothetical protein [Sediminibacterium sp.]